ncbi:ABC transporter ATP-binding protein [Telmatospirillum siberiense]|uniref:ABC transporter ATP-binding protein n=1 Tax=Telmatospirillum siberiense TaxID=382514 RepID=A0A2N3PMT3_9PROT|nr:ABC transporter ATP-binding protein [Telmatospirillum siberiense]PKU21693.1 ABC transporter ATP-binding protein [Telmatospirillum siberiense]
MTALLKADNLSVAFDMGWQGWLPPRRLSLRAVDGVSLTIDRGETLGLIGESGSGKTSLGRAILRRLPLAGGSVTFDGIDVTRMSGAPLRRLRRRMQMVFQDPYASLNPRMSVGDIIAEPLSVHRLGSPGDAADRVAAVLEMVGLPADSASRYPHAFSGGQRQRIGIARALISEPEFIVADEPVSALDVSVRAQIVNLLQDLKSKLGLTTLFIAHDLAVVRHISNRIAILYAGHLVELAPTESLYSAPLHPYTEALLSAVPATTPGKMAARRRIVLKGEPPSLLSPSAGCRFASRCPKKTARCEIQAPPLEERRPGHLAACWEA